jgi:hypothetical protein
MQNDPQNNFIFKFNPASNSELGYMIPTSLIQQGLMSGTSEAIACFVGQEFSNKLQAYMINYVAAVSSYYPLYA